MIIVACGIRFFISIKKFIIIRNNNEGYKYSYYKIYGGGYNMKRSISAIVVLMILLAGCSSTKADNFKDWLQNYKSEMVDLKQDIEKGSAEEITDEKAIDLIETHQKKLSDLEASITNIKPTDDEEFMYDQMQRGAYTLKDEFDYFLKIIKDQGNQMQKDFTKAMLYSDTTTKWIDLNLNIIEKYNNGEIKNSEDLNQVINNNKNKDE